MNKFMDRLVPGRKLAKSIEEITAGVEQSTERIDGIVSEMDEQQKKEDVLVAEIVAQGIKLRTEAEELSEESEKTSERLEEKFSIVEKKLGIYED